jgi:uncharacterized protein (DUF2236 family)
MGGFDPVRMWLPGPGPGRRGDPGLFPPGTVARHVNAETTLLLGGGRALLLQLAHPMVAAGVADHSDFRRDAFIRLANTLDLTLTVSFGDEHQRRAAVARVTDSHQRVAGERNGRPYRALDPELLRGSTPRSSTAHSQPTNGSSGRSAPSGGTATTRR